VNLEVVDRNPVDRVPAPKIRRTRMVVWEPDEALHFLRAARESPLYAMYLLAITSTMGPAELWGLQKGDIHLKGGYLWVVQNLEDVDGHIRLDETKNENRRRRIDLPRMVVEALREHLKANMDKGPFVFTSPEGHPLRRQNFYRREWRPLLAKAAKSAEDAARSAGRTEYAFPRIRPYDLRHTCNALMAYLGVQIQVARERMGHSSIKTTDDVYGHLYESMQRDVADKFDRFLEAL
jgi:integrase